MKFSFRQILASAGGAVLAAIIASIFGVKGTVIGVAIGSMAATSGTALVAKSIERGQKAVHQAVVRVPAQSSLLRRLGGTGAAGAIDHSDEPTSPLAEETTNAAVAQLATPTGEPATVQQPAILPGPTITAAGLATETFSPAADSSADESAPGHRIRWPVVAGTAAIIFVLSLAFVTTVELIAGRPLADLFGGHVKGANPSIVKVFENPPATTTTVTVPTTSTTSTSSTTTTSSTSTTTTTTAVGGTTSSTDVGSSSSTSTTTSGGLSTTTTTSASG
jgi:hypothetical protein